MPPTCIKNEDNTSAKNSSSKENRTISPTEQVQDIRNLFILFVEQQESILRIISDKLDKLENHLSDFEDDVEER